MSGDRLLSIGKCRFQRIHLLWSPSASGTSTITRTQSKGQRMDCSCATRCRNVFRRERKSKRSMQNDSKAGQGNGMILLNEVCYTLVLFFFILDTVLVFGSMLDLLSYNCLFEPAEQTLMTLDKVVPNTCLGHCEV